MSLGVSTNGGNAGFSSSNFSEDASNGRQTILQNGREEVHLNFGATAAAFRKIADLINPRHFWVLLDEWSSVPLDLQPFLGDLLRRSLFPVKGITTKIAAIEHRSSFSIRKEDRSYIGIEAGADAAADVNLDDFMVFDNDSERAQEFFNKLVLQHVQAVVADDDDDDDLQIPSRPEDIISGIFTEKRASEEFARACEGVPRDAINIISLAAQKALDSAISVQHIRTAARNWYQRDKETAIRSEERADALLKWIIDEVIGSRRARAFLLRSDVENVIIDTLYDSRVIHILKKGVSTHDQPGIRYDVYKLDYGCYVDLISTARAPQGLLPLDDFSATEELNEPERYIEVPPDDYRSIRRAILDIENFERLTNNVKIIE